ncbi:hypothetical protein [Oceanobacillus sp. CAU 1775]
MKIKVAAFGTKDTVGRLMGLASNYEDIEILPFIYRKAEETVDLLNTVFASDVYLFCDPISYQYAKDKISKKRLATVMVDFDPYALSTNFYSIQQIDTQRLAIDVTNESTLEETINALDIKDKPTYVYVHDPYEYPNIQKIVSYYQDLWENEKIDYVLSSLEEVTDQLKEKNIACDTLKIPDFNLVNAIEDSLSLANLKDSENKQIVTGYVSVKGLNRTDETIAPYAEDVLDKLKGILQSFTNKTDANFVRTTDDTIMVFGTDKILKHLKEHYREFPLLQELKSTMKLPVYLGFGLGLNAKESAANASIALEACKKSEHSICYIVNERQEMIGPIGIKKEIDTSSLYRALIHDARLNNELSYNFIDFIKERNNEPFSTNDVALFYQVTKRSAERTVNKLLTGKVIKISGKERPYTKGRPRKLFTLNQ